MILRIAACFALACLLVTGVTKEDAFASGQVTCARITEYSNGNVFVTCYQADGSSAVYELEKDAGDLASSRNALILQFMAIQALKKNKAPALSFDYYVSNGQSFVGTVYLE